jgi:hypothetical protein
MNIVKMRNDKAYGNVYENFLAGKYKDGYGLLADDLHLQYGLTDHPKRGLLFLMAFHKGIKGGIPEIINWYDELSNLLV